MSSSTAFAKRVVVEGLGWILVVAGIAALVLPGPGLLALAGGLVLLSQQYDWAERRVEPIKLRAMQGAAESVENRFRIAVSILGVLALVGFGVLWIVSPPVPGWWPVADRWWLPGGLGTGITQIGSAVIAAALLVYSYRRFHGKPEARAALDADLEDGWQNDD